MPKNRISTSYWLQRIFVTLLYGGAIVIFVNDFSLIGLMFATIIFVSIWLFTYLTTSTVEFDSAFMYVNQSGIKSIVSLDSVSDIGIAGSFRRQKSYCVKYLYGQKICTVMFSGRILLTNFEDVC